VNILDRVVFSSKAKSSIDWLEIESRLHDISAPSDSPDLAIEPYTTLANDPAGSALGDSVVSLSPEQITLKPRRVSSDFEGGRMASNSRFSRIS